MGKVSTLQEENANLKRKMESLETKIAAVKKVATEARKVADAAMSKVN